MVVRLWTRGALSTPIVVAELASAMSPSFPLPSLTPTKSERGLQMQQKRRRILSINIFEPRKETLLMTYDSISRQPTPLPVPQSEQVLACLNESCQALAVGSNRRARPPTFIGLHFCLCILPCVFR